MYQIPKQNTSLKIPYEFQNVFEKGFEYKFHEEIYLNNSVIRHPTPVYRLRDQAREISKGRFHIADLSRARVITKKSTSSVKKFQQDEKKKFWCVEWNTERSTIAILMQKA